MVGPEVWWGDDVCGGGMVVNGLGSSVSESLICSSVSVSLSRSASGSVDG